MLFSVAVPAGRAAAGHGERPGPRAGLGGALRRRRPAAADPGEAGESYHQDAGPVRPERGKKTTLLPLFLALFSTIKHRLALVAVKFSTRFSLV